MLICAGVNAQTDLTPDLRHFIFANVDAGYSALLHTIKQYPASAGMNANIGVGYRLYYNHFLFSAGVEGAYQLNTNNINDQDFSISMRDTEGDVFDMHVLVNKSWDRTHMVNLNIPLLFGGEWGRLYFMIGPKVAINMYGSAASEAEYTTYGEYDRYYEDFWNMENHQFVKGNKMQSGLLPIKWNLNVLAHLELGARVDKYYKYKIYRANPDRVRMYLAAYVDCGVLGLTSAQKGNPIFDYKETTDKGLQFYIQPLMRSNLADNAIVRNLNVGVKFTIAFELHQDTKSFIYDYKKVNRDYRKRGGTQIIEQ